MGCRINMDLVPARFRPMFARLAEITTRVKKWKRVVTHQLPIHLDEEVAYWMLRKFGGEIFPGIRDAEFIFRLSNDHSDLFGGQTWEQHALAGTLLLGTGGDSPFNEHQLEEEEERAEGLCVTTLVGLFLGKHDDRALQYLYDYVLANDEHGQGSKLDLAMLVKSGYEGIEEGDPDALPPREQLYLRLFQYDQIYRSQQRFWACEAECYERAEVGKFTVRGEEHTVVSIESERRQMSAFAFAEFKASVVIVKNPKTGVIAVLTRRKARITLERVAVVLRWEEAKRRGKTLDRAVAAKFTKGGRVKESPEWYLAFRRKNALINRAGSVIPLDEIRNLVKATLAS